MSQTSLRQVYVEELMSIAKEDSRIVSLDCDSREATMADCFANLYPERSFSFGIAEQDMVTAAGGMATMGLIPFVNSYAMFIATRALDQVLNSIAYADLNVKMVISHHGLDVGADGVTHQLTEDIAIFRTIPNLKLLQPADGCEMRQMVNFAVNTPGPVIIKSGKSKVPELHGDDFQWEYGKPSLIADGTDVALISNGVLLNEALSARKLLQAEGVSAAVINLSSLTDVDEERLLELTEGVRLLVTAEDHSIYGGIGGIVAEIFSEKRPTRLKRVGLGRHFAECGQPGELFAKYRMDSSAITEAVKAGLS